MGAFAVAAAAFGIVIGNPTALLLGTVGVAYSAYAREKTAPVPEIEVERGLSEVDVRPGDEIQVDVELTNVGQTVLPDLRVVDGVPDQLQVVDGSARLGTALRPGESAAFSYIVEADRGEHVWRPTTVAARNWSGTAEREAEFTEETGFTCVRDLRPMEEFPLRQQTIEHAGDVTTSTGGSGLEFHTVREYRHGDPMKRIDWNRKAKTGDFQTVEYREERAATVALVVDTREAAYVDDADGFSAVEHAVHAAGRTAMTLMDNGMQVGVASFGPEWTWLPPGMGRDQEARLREMISVGSGLGPEPSSGSFKPEETIKRLRRYLPGDSQVVFFSPATDDYLMTAVRRFEAYGHVATLVTPDVTDPSTPGGQLAQLERDRRLRQVRRTGIPVIEWDPDEKLEFAIDRAQRRWLR